MSKRYWVISEFEVHGFFDHLKDAEKLSKSDPKLSILDRKRGIPDV